MDILELREFHLQLQTNLKNGLNQLDNLDKLTKPKVCANFEGVSGLFYIGSYLSANEIIMLQDKLSTEIQLTNLNLTNPSSRRVAHFGYNYAYNQSGLTLANKIPDYLANLVTTTRVNELIANLVSSEFDQVIINEYKPGQQIAYHTDHTTMFGPIIACLTVGEAVPIHFRINGVHKTVKPEIGSMYIMTGPSRYQWQHHLKNTGDTNRYSITYRTVVKN